MKFKFNKSKLKEIFRKLVVTYLFLFFCLIIMLPGLLFVSLFFVNHDYTPPHCGGESISEEEIERRNCICLHRNLGKSERLYAYWKCDDETLLHKIKIKFLLVLLFPLILLFSPLYFFYDYWILTLFFIVFYFYFLLKLLKKKNSFLIILILFIPIFLVFCLDFSFFDLVLFYLFG